MRSRQLECLLERGGFVTEPTCTHNKPVKEVKFRRFFKDDYHDPAIIVGFAEEADGTPSAFRHDRPAEYFRRGQKFLSLLSRPLRILFQNGTINGHISSYYPKVRLHNRVDKLNKLYCSIDGYHAQQKPIVRRQSKSLLTDDLQRYWAGQTECSQYHNWFHYGCFFAQSNVVEHCSVSWCAISPTMPQQLIDEQNETENGSQQNVLRARSSE